MAVTTDNYFKDFTASVDRSNGITDGAIYNVNPEDTYNVAATVTSAGTAVMKQNIASEMAEDFASTDWSEVYNGTGSASFARRLHGVTQIGLDVSSGTWDLIIRKVQS